MEKSKIISREDEAYSFFKTAGSQISKNDETSIFGERAVSKL